MLRLSLKCVILNDIEDIKVENLSCIVGHPNLSTYTHITDSVFSTKSTKEFLDELNGSGSSSSYSSHSKNHQYTSNRFNLQMNSPRDVMKSSDDEDDDRKQDTNDDFHLYKFQHVLLEKDERLSLPIFDMQVPYKDVYHCEIDPENQSNEKKKSKSDCNEYVITAEVRHWPIFFVNNFS
jgi:hypothetical protein